MPTIDELREKALGIVNKTIGRGVVSGDGVSPQTKEALVRSGIFDPKVDFAPAAPAQADQPGYVPDPTEAELERKRAQQIEYIRKQRAEDAERRRRALEEQRFGAKRRSSFGTPTGSEEPPFGGVPR